MIQNVCLDAAGAVRIGRSPLDGEAACPRQRDLLPGERLPYHKHDHPSPAERQDAPSGYQRHDLFPVETQGLGTVVEHSFDFGDGGRRFGVFDRGSDGGDVAMHARPISPARSRSPRPKTAAGSSCGSANAAATSPPDALARSWLILEFDPKPVEPLRGETVARLNAVPARSTA